MADKTTSESYGPILDFLSVDTNMVSIGFVAIAAVLVWKGLPILSKMLDDQSSKISAQLDEVAKVKAEAEALLAQYKEKHENAMQEAEGIVEQAKVDAERLKEKAEADLALSLERRKAAMDTKIEQMEARAVQELQRKTVELALAAARSSMASNSEGNQGLLDQAINDLPSRLN